MLVCITGMSSFCVSVWAMRCCSRYPHSMLAAAALLLALSVTCAPAAAQTELPACGSKRLIVASCFHVQAILEDLELHFPEAAHLEELGFFWVIPPRPRINTPLWPGSQMFPCGNCILALINELSSKANCGRDLQSLWLMTFANQENMCPL